MTTAVQDRTRPQPEERLAAVAEMSAVRWSAAPVLLPSHSNDSWSFDDPSRGPCVLRVCWRGDRGRLITEARLGRALPREFGYPRVLGFGHTRDERDLSWLITRRLPGATLGSVWPDLDEAARRRAVVGVAERLALLHRWRPSATITDRLLSWPRSTDPQRIATATINPLPLSRLRLLADRLDDRVPAQSGLVQRALDWLTRHPELAPEWDRPGLPVTHGDLHLENVWWDGEEVRTLLDLEWARLAPAYLDLARMADEGAAPDASTDPAFVRLLLAAYPELDVPQLTDRLRYVRIAYQLRGLLLGPSDHPVSRLRALLDSDLLREV